MGGKWHRTCWYCNKLIEGKAFKDGKCPNDGVVFWIHPSCYQKKIMNQTSEGKMTE